jgi:putative membrane-bound dehydrogenase-like protein
MLRALFALFLCGFSTSAADPDPRLAGYRTPPGWKVEIAATEPLVINPVTMTSAPDGRLFVIEWKAGGGPNDLIKALKDTDGDGTFDQADIYMDSLELPAGICFWDGWTYVTLGHEVVRFHDPELDGSYDRREVVVSGFGNDNSHHRVSGLIIGPDGWLYMTTGDSDAHAKGSDGSTATVLRSGGVFRCRPDGSSLENVAFGMRNPWGNVAFDDEFRIFHTDNDNEGSPGFTGCRILHVVEGGDYGWRLREGARCCQPDFERATWNGGRPGRLGWVAETGRGAPAGLCVLNSAAFPPSTRNLLVYPDVFRKLVRAYKVKPNGASFTVAEEFELLASDEGLFRPTDAEIGPDGALYVLDWRTDSGGAGQLSGNGKTGRIYRMTWTGTPKEPALPALPRDRFEKLGRAGNEALLMALKNVDYGLRRAAGLEILRRGSELRRYANAYEGVTEDDDFEQIEALFGKHIEESMSFGSFVRLELIKLGWNRPEPAAWHHALVILATLNSSGDGSESVFDWSSLVWRAGLDEDPATRRLRLESIARFADRSDPEVSLSLLAESLPTDAPSLRALALALGRFSKYKRQRFGSNLEPSRLLREYGQASLAITLRKIPEDPEEFEDYTESVRDDRWTLRETYKQKLSSDVFVQRILAIAEKADLSDSFVQDGLIRGLERLGSAGREAVESSAGARGSKTAAVSLAALQSWRGPEGVPAMVALATGTTELEPADHANLFRGLRELVADAPPAPIAEWLAKSPAADAAVRVEAVHLLGAMHLRAADSARPILVDLLVDGDADVRRAALALASEIRAPRILASLVNTVEKRERPADERRLALTAIRGYENRNLLPILSDCFDPKGDPGFNAELLRVIAPLDFAAAALLARSSLDAKSPELRHASIALLGQKPLTAIMVADMYNAGKLPPEDLPRVIEAVRPHSTPEIQHAMQSLLKSKLLAAPTGSEARQLREFVSRNGNALRGRAIYLDAKKGGCATCHRLEGVGGSVGPDLTRVWQTLSFDKRVESLLDPSKEIKEGFSTFKVATKDGRTMTGLLLSNTPEGVRLRDAQGREVKILAAEIEDKGTDPVSLMPVGVVGHLSFAEFADLLAFLGDRSAQESLKEKP